MYPEHPARILLVEDSAVEATVLLEATERAAPGRYEFAVVASLPAALKRLGRAATDCVLLDLGLPGSAGAAAVGALRESAPATPLVALSALGNSQEALEAIRHGADDCLEKSGFDARQLVRTIDLAIERGAARARLLKLALRDPLTGLANRAHFEESLARAAARAGRSGNLMALLYLDLDGFKLTNDALGHDGGDALLKAVAARFAGQVRAGDTLARIGGDEFAVILENLLTADSAAVVARKLVAALEAPILVGHEEVRVGASVGIAFRPTDGVAPGDLVRAADRAMYAAKRLGGNRIGSYSRLLTAGSGTADRLHGAGRTMAVASSRRVA
jgi:diguanylate cyclase (GGDEF)-like protein